MKIIITGATGMVGEGVLLECLDHPLVTEILSVSRKPTGLAHGKLKELIVPDFLNLPENDRRLQGYDACFFCAGVSSIGKTEREYARLTYDTTLHFAKALGPTSQMSFMYVSGSGTDSDEKGRIMWARVKGKTENALIGTPFRRAYGFRVGIMEAAAGQKNALSYYKYFAWAFPALKAVLPGAINTMREVAQAMIFLAKYGYEKNIITIRDVSLLARRLEESLANK